MIHYKELPKHIVLLQCADQLGISISLGTFERIVTENLKKVYTLTTHRVNKVNALISCKQDGNDILSS